MRKIIGILAILSIIYSCDSNLDKLVAENPYAEGTRKLNIQLVYPEGYESEVKKGVTIMVINPSNRVQYKLKTDERGFATIDLQYGFYRVTASDKGEPEFGGIMPLFNGSIDQTRVTDESTEDINIEIDFVRSYTNQLVIKEIYHAGSALVEPPATKNQYDKYLIIYNNSDKIAYLDSLCFGMVGSGYNAPSSPTPWSYMSDGQRVIMEDIPITLAAWQFPGNGNDYPLQPGEETVIAVCAAIDHTILYPELSVNLNVSGYWVTYDYGAGFTNASYHPAPGANLAGHYLRILSKWGAGNAYTLSVSSPALVIFRIQDPEGAVSYANQTKNPQNFSKEPGSAGATLYLMIPGSWVLDGVECFDAGTKYKRVPPLIDASYSLLPTVDQYKGYTHHRKIDVQATAEAGGRIVYQDTNNSIEDFEIRKSQSIKK